jgi:hypothetical protein
MEVPERNPEWSILERLLHELVHSVAQPDTPMARRQLPDSWPAGQTDWEPSGPQNGPAATLTVAVETGMVLDQDKARDRGELCGQTCQGNDFPSREPRRIRRADTGHVGHLGHVRINADTHLTVHVSQPIAFTDEGEAQGGADLWYQRTKQARSRAFCQ